MRFYKQPTIKVHRLQIGVTLISLLIGMLISIFSVLSILALYKNLVTVSISASSDASHDGQVATALVTAQLELQNAGYGIANADGLHLNTNANGTEIRWRYYDNGAYQCRLIREIVIDANTRKLEFFEADKNCDATSELSSVAWKSLSVLTRISRTEAIPEQIFTFSVATTKCSPYGVGATDKHLVVSMSAIGSADFHNTTSDITATSYSLCLISTHPA